MNFGSWLGLVSLVISLLILWKIQQLLLLLFTAIVLATALNRIVRWLQQQFQLKRNRAIAITLSFVFLITLLFFWLIVPPFIEQWQKLLELIPIGFQRIRSQLMALELQQFQWLPELPTWTELTTQLQPVLTRLLQNFFVIFSNSVGVLLQLLLIVVLVLLLLANPLQYRQLFLLLFPSFYRGRANEILDQCEVALGNWLAGIFLSCLFVGIASALGLSLLKVQLVLAHGLIAGLFNFIPNIGPTASMIFPIMVALLDAPWKIIPIFILYFIVQNLESYWLSPMVMARQVSLLPAVTLTAQIFFASFFGILGLILALPLTVVAKTWVDEMLFKDILDRWELSHFSQQGIGNRE